MAIGLGAVACSAKRPDRGADYAGLAEAGCLGRGAGAFGRAPACSSRWRERARRGAKPGGVAGGVVLAAIVPPGVLSSCSPRAATMPFDWTRTCRAWPSPLLLASRCPRGSGVAHRRGALRALATAAFFVDRRSAATPRAWACCSPVRCWPPRCSVARDSRALARARRCGRRAAAAVLAAGARGQAAAASATTPAARPYYRPLLAFLAGRPAPLRVEVPPTRFHWEANYVPARFPITRGWERQLDIRYAHLFYPGR